MTLAAGPWYTSATSSTILSAAGVLAAVVIAVVTTKLVRRPLRRSLQFATEVQHLADGPPDRPEPYLVTFSLANRSRADIRRDDFDGDNPLAFDFGTPVELLGAARPSNEDHARFHVQGNRILVGPALIRHGETLSLRLLTSKPPAVRIQNSLAEVSLREKRGGHWRTVVTIPLIGVLLVATTLAAGLVSHYLTSSGGHAATAGPEPTVTVTAPGAASSGAEPDMALINPNTGQPPQLQSTSFVLADPASGGIRALAFSPDGKQLAAGDTNGSFLIWNVAARTFTTPSPGEPNSLGVYAVAFSQDGSHFATGDGNGDIYLWSPQFKLKATLHDQDSNGVRAVAFSPDGKFVAAGDGSGHIYVWSVASHTAQVLHDPGSSGVNAVAFSPDNSYLAAGDGNGHTFRWVHTSNMDEHQQGSVAVRALAFSRSGRYLAVGDVNGTTYIWDTTTWTVVSTPALSQFTFGINAVAFSPDGKYLATGDRNGHVYLWTGVFSGGTPNVVLQSTSSDFQQTGAITAITFSPDGSYLAAGSSNGHLYEWNASF